MTDERARVEAWVKEWFAENVNVRQSMRVPPLVDAILAYGAVQRAEEREACEKAVESLKTTGQRTGKADLWDMVILHAIQAIRARRDG